MQDAIRGLFSSLPLEELPPIAPPAEDADSGSANLGSIDSENSIVNAPEEGSAR